MTPDVIELAEGAVCNLKGTQLPRCHVSRLPHLRNPFLQSTERSKGKRLGQIFTHGVRSILIGDRQPLSAASAGEYFFEEPFLLQFLHHTVVE